MDRLFTRRGVMIGAGSAATAALVPVAEAAADKSILEAQPASAGVTELTKDRVALTAFGSLELPTVYLGNETAIFRTRDINCQLYLSTRGELYVDSLDYSDRGAFVQLSDEQHEALLAAFTRYASAHVLEVAYHEPVQPKEFRS